MRDAFIRGLTKLAEQDPLVTLVTGDLGFGVLTDFANRFPDQFVNAGVAEQNMTAIACGMALEGRRVYTYSIANFTTLRCLEQIRNDVCYHDANVTVVSVGAGFSYGQLGMSHFATEDIAILRSLPNITVVSPTEIWETEDLTQELACRQGPAYFRLDKSIGGSPRRDGEIAVHGKARRVREGHDISIVATGGILSEAIGAAEVLAKSGIQCRVIAVHTIKPLDDAEMLASVNETGGVITLEEHTIIGGLGGALAELFVESGTIPRHFRRIGLRDQFPTIVGDQSYLRSAYGMDTSAVVSAVHDVLR